jgi:hypothetical protein
MADPPTSHASPSDTEAAQARHDLTIPPLT